MTLNDQIKRGRELPIPQSVEAEIEKEAEKVAENIFGSYGNLHADEAEHFLQIKNDFKQGAKFGYELGRNQVNAELEEQCKINAIGAQRELKLMAEISELQDKLYHESRRAPEIEYKLGHEIEVLKAKLKIAADAMKKSIAMSEIRELGWEDILPEALKQITEGGWLKMNGHQIIVHYELWEQMKLERENLKFELDRIKAERDAYRDALSYYADKMNWYDPRLVGGSDQNAIWKDSEDVLIKSLDKHIVIGGKKARDVLSRFNNEGKKET